ncbi:MAG: DUF1292 domain-containing protein [Clostridia bacterium]
MSENEVECNGVCNGCPCHGEHTQEEPEFDGKVTLVDEDGNEVDFEVIDAVLLEENEYIIVAPAESITEDADIEVVVLKVDNVDGEESYVTVTDDEEFDKVFKAFQKQNEDELNFSEEK